MSAAGSDRILERMMTLHPKVIDLTLDRVWRLLEALELYEQWGPLADVAGTMYLEPGDESTDGAARSITLSITLLASVMLSTELDRCIAMPLLVAMEI